MEDENAKNSPEDVVEEVTRLLANHSRFADPYPFLARLRETNPVVFAAGMGFATRYDDVVSVYRDDRFSRYRQAVAEIESHVVDESDELIAKVRDTYTSMLINQDEPGHRRMRQILEVAFQPARIAEWRKRVEDITDELITNVSGKAEFDLLKELAFPLPERIICEMVGVPYEDHALWAKWSAEGLNSARTYEPSPEQMAVVHNARRNFYLYFRDLVRKRSRNLGDDLVSLLIRAESEDGRLSELEVLGNLQMLIQAGYETTGNLIANGMHALLSFPDQYEKLRAEPDLVPGAVEEMLRYVGPSHWSLPREPVEDVELAGRTIPEGCPMVLALNAANRDPGIFDDPETFDITRKHNRHLGFAVGPHICLGNQLARMEAQIMFRAIIERLPRLELVKEPRLKDTFVRAFEELIVRPA